jgi:hypothetical protein
MDCFSRPDSPASAFEANDPRCWRVTHDPTLGVEAEMLSRASREMLCSTFSFHPSALHESCPRSVYV